jgi:hypothetical protein
MLAVIHSCRRGARRLLEYMQPAIQQDVSSSSQIVMAAQASISVYL